MQGVTSNLNRQLTDCHGLEQYGQYIRNIIQPHRTGRNRVLRSSLRNWLVNHKAAANYNQKNIHPPSLLHAIWWCLDTRHVNTLSMLLDLPIDTPCKHSTNTCIYLFHSKSVKPYQCFYYIHRFINHGASVKKKPLSTQINFTVVPYVTLWSLFCAVTTLHIDAPFSQPDNNDQPGKPSFGTISPCYKMNKIEGNVC